MDMYCIYGYFQSSDIRHYNFKTFVIVRSRFLLYELSLNGIMFKFILLYNAELLTTIVLHTYTKDVYVLTRFFFQIPSINDLHNTIYH